jgi:ketosteroid isomerase-like protein
MKRTMLISTCLLIALSFSASLAFSQANEGIKAKVEKLNSIYTKGILEGNSEKIVSLFAADAISMPSYQPMQEGIAAIRKAEEDNIKGGWKASAFEIKSLKIISSGNLVTDIGTYKVTFTLPGLQKPVDDHGKYLSVWEKQHDGSLKLKVNTWNSDLDPMAKMPAQEQSNK